MIWNIVSFVVLMTVVAWVQVHQLIQRNQKKVAVSYLFLMCTALGIGAFLFAGIQLPSPAVPIRAVFGHIGKMVLGQ